MRWKLLIIAPLAAVLAGAGGGAALLYLLRGWPAPTAHDDLSAAVALLLPLAAITYASVFVYRRTARRRKLQAAATALVSLALTIAVYFALALYTACCSAAPPPGQTPPAPAPRNVG